MNELIEVTKGIATCNQNEVAKQMMTVFRAVTPQFYRSMTDAELKAELLSIKLLTQSIDQQTLAEMCRLAVGSYAITRSVNSKIYFDMNYILTFYVQAFNKVHCYDVQLPKDAVIKERAFNIETNTITEIWGNANQTIEIKFIETAGDKRNVHYSPKLFESLYSNLEDLKDVEI